MHAGLQNPKKKKKRKFYDSTLAALIIEIFFNLIETIGGRARSRGQVLIAYTTLP